MRLRSIFIALTIIWVFVLPYKILGTPYLIIDIGKKIGASP